MPRTNHFISVIVLAAGESKRMGRMKQLLPFRNSTIIEQVVSNVVDADISEIIVVLGHQDRRIAHRLAGKPLKTVLNRDYRQGMSSSIKCGLDHISETAAAVMIVLGDQPLIGRDIIDKLVAEFARNKRGIVAPVHQGRRGHPVIFAARYNSELARLEGDTGAKKVIEAHPGDMLEVEVDSESIFADIDNQNDYQLQQRSDPARSRLRHVKKKDEDH